jgi:GNAT superfamily N-acetyltransferase
MQHLTFKRLLPTASQPELVAFHQIFEYTYIETFHSYYTPEDLAAYCAERLSFATFTAELAQPNAYFYGFWQGDVLVGYAKWMVPCTQYLTDDLIQRYTKPFLLDRFYLTKAVQGSGLADVAMQFVMSHAEKVHGADFAYLDVWDGNLKAQRFYQKFGFRTLTTVAYHVGNTKDRDYIYGKVLTP